jgi:hypothetical protein
MEFILKTINIITFILLLFSASNASAFTFSNSVGAAFDQDVVTVNVNAAGCTNISTSNNLMLDIVKTSINRFWNKVPTSKLKMQVGTFTTVAAAFKTDDLCTNPGNTTCDINAALLVSNNILITCNTSVNNFPSTNVLAAAVPNNISGQTTIGGIVVINDLVTSQFGSKTFDDQVAIVAHEIGHVLGLGHSPASDSLMYFRTVNYRRSLGADDMDGITYLYPASQPISCGTIELTNGSENISILSLMVLILGFVFNRKLKV